MSDAHSHDAAHGHDHGHDHAPGNSRVLLAALGLTGGFAAIEFITGWLSGSLALIGDAGHMVTDSMALGLGAIAAYLSQRPPSARHSFGLQRAEIVGALLNAGLMLVMIAWIAFEAVARLLEPQPVNGTAVLLVAGIGLAVNLVVLRVLHGGEQNLNTRGALLHVLGDLLGSVAALASGVVIVLTGWTPVDPILSLIICALILVSTSRLLKEAVHVVMEGVPPHIDLREVGERMASVDGVLGVHDLHVWTLSTGSHAIAAHVRVTTLTSWPERLRVLEQLLMREFGIDHVTLQPEPPYEVTLVGMPEPGRRQTESDPPSQAR